GDGLPERTTLGDLSQKCSVEHVPGTEGGLHVNFDPGDTARLAAGFEHPGAFAASSGDDDPTGLPSSALQQLFDASVPEAPLERLDGRDVQVQAVCGEPIDQVSAVVGDGRSVFERSERLHRGPPADVVGVYPGGGGEQVAGGSGGGEVSPRERPVGD